MTRLYPRNLASMLFLATLGAGCSSSSTSSGPETSIICQPDEMLCSGNLLQRCTPDGKRYETAAECDLGCEGAKCVEPEVCYADCTGKECGDDGCGGRCGVCPDKLLCLDGGCVDPDLVCDLGDLTCQGENLMECALDMKGWELLELCLYGCELSKCKPEPACVPECGDLRCGDDGCGGSCGFCLGTQECVGGRCEPKNTCVPKCEEKQCGPDGCGASCGTCPEGFKCAPLTGQCEELLPGVVSGSVAFHFAVPQFNEYGGIDLAGPGLMHATGLAVLVYSSDAQTLLAGGEVQQDGTFAVHLDQPLQGNETVLLAALWIPNWSIDAPIPLSVLAPTSGGSPAPGMHDHWVWSIAIDESGYAGDILIDIANGSGAVFLLRIAVQGMKTIVDDFLDGDYSKLASLALLWNNCIDWSCGACYSNVAQFGKDVNKIADNSIWISGGPQGSSAWGSPVVLHELGHFVAHNYSRDDSPGGAHYFGQPIAPAFAWSEGWASFFAVSTFSSVLGEISSLFWDIQQGTSFWIDYDAMDASEGLEFVPPNPSGSMEQQLDENWVVSMIWHLWDGADFPDPDDDGVAMGTHAIVEAITSSRFIQQDRGAEGADFVDFVDALMCLAPSSAQSVADMVVNFLGFPHDGAPVCSQRQLAPMEISIDLQQHQQRRFTLEAWLEVKQGLQADTMLELYLPDSASIVEGLREENLGRPNSGDLVKRSWTISGDPTGLKVTATAANQVFGAQCHASWPEASSQAHAPNFVPITPVTFRGVTFTKAIPLRAIHHGL